jgi:tetratricopeptide (TPR) repeat protein
VKRGISIELLISMALIVATIAVFWQVGNNGFINYDDPGYVFENPHVASGLSQENIRWAFTAIHMSNWHPLTWISHMIDCQFFGLDPRGHHFTSLALHILNTLLLFFFLARTTGAHWRSCCVAALFALHPLHVESVAWVAERKDVLSAFFWMLTIWAYAGYAKRPGHARYVLVALIFALGLMAKGMLVTLPFVLLLLDYWPLGRFTSAGERTDRRRPTRLIIEKLPLLALAIASSAVTYLAQEKWGSITHDSTFAANLGNALITYLIYIKKTVWPDVLAIFYPFNPAGVTITMSLAAALILACVSILVIRDARRHSYLFVGWFWYLVTLLPVIGIVRLGQHAMADRYTYIPLIGLFIIVAWGVSDLKTGVRWERCALIPAAVAILSVSAVLTWRQVGRWRDSVTLFSHAVEVTDNNWLAYVTLSEAYVEQGNLVEALRNISTSLIIKPNPFGYAQQGWIYAQLGDFAASIDACQRAIIMDPLYDKAHFLLGRNYIYLRGYPAAVAEFRILQKNGSTYAPELLEHLKANGIDVLQ